MFRLIPNLYKSNNSGLIMVRKGGTCAQYEKVFGCRESVVSEVGWSLQTMLAAPPNKPSLHITPLTNENSVFFSDHRYKRYILHWPAGCVLQLVWKYQIFWLTWCVRPSLKVMLNDAGIIILYWHACCPEAFNMYIWKIVFKVSLVRFSSRSALAIEKDIVDASEVLLQGIKTCRVVGKALRTLAILFLGSSKVKRYIC